MAEFRNKDGTFNRETFARTNAIKARKKRLRAMADPENLGTAIDEVVTRLALVTTTLTKEAMLGRHPSEEWAVVRPMVRATVLSALIEKAAGLFPELCLKEGTPEERVPLSASKLSKRAGGKSWAGVLTAAHVERYGDRVCPVCELRLVIGEEVRTPAGSDWAYHPTCTPGYSRPGPGDGKVRVFSVAQRHLDRRPGTACHHCSAPFVVGVGAVWRFGWTAMLHEACWAELGKPEALK